MPHAKQKILNFFQITKSVFGLIDKYKIPSYKLYAKLAFYEPPFPLKVIT